MASTYSTNLALELIGTGDQSGTWGSTNNTNLGTLVEQAISGYVTQAITDGADTTITIPNGTSGVARNMFLELTGVLTAARNLVVPANKKLYFIYNNTSGGFAVTVKVSGQTGVSVPNGAKVILVSNGTDIVTAENTINGTLIPSSATLATTATSQTLTNKTISGSANTLSNISLTSSVTGTLPVANGGTGTTTLTGYLLGNGTGAFSATLTIPTAALSGQVSIANGGTGAADAATARANLGAGTGNGTVTSVSASAPAFLSVSVATATTTPAITLSYSGTALPVANGGTGVTTSTGSGNVVLSTSPTLVTPVLGTPSSGNLSSCTADGTNAVGYRNIPQSSNTTLAVSDVGKSIRAAGAITIPNSTFSAGDVVTIINTTGSNITITTNLSTTYLAGTATTGTSRTLAQRGIATIYFDSGTVGYISGAGLT